jgi:mono/diheme cytochrome c family protein
MARFGWLLISAFVGLSAPALGQNAVERGNYLVNTVLTCGNCHTPKGPPAATAGKDFSGFLEFDEPPFKVTASNITPDKETGIGNYTDAQLKTVLRKGIKPNGTPVAMVMPSAFYEIMTEKDLDAVVAYLKTLKPVSNKVVEPIYKMPQHHQVPPGGDKPYTEAMLTDKVKKGFYLTTIAHCMECHTPLGPRGREFDAKYGAGGAEFPGPWGKSVSRNITSSKTSGIGDWSDDEIKRAITQGVRKDGTPLKPPMGFEYYAKMSGEDLDAIVAYLRTVPAKD